MNSKILKKTLPHADTTVVLDIQYKKELISHLGGLRSDKMTDRQTDGQKEGRTPAVSRYKSCIYEKCNLNEVHNTHSQNVLKSVAHVMYKYPHIKDLDLSKLKEKNSIYIKKIFMYTYCKYFQRHKALHPQLLQILPPCYSTSI